MAKKQKVKENSLLDFPEIPNLSNDEVIFGKYPNEVFNKILNFEKENPINSLHIDTLSKLAYLGGDLKYKNGINSTYKNKCVCFLQSVIASTTGFYWIKLDNPKAKVCCCLIRELCG